MKETPWGKVKDWVETPVANPKTADDWATKEERIHWIVDLGKVVANSLKSQEERGATGGIVYKHMQRTKRVLKSLYLREMEDG